MRKRNLVKKMTALVLAGTMTASLAACGGGQGAASGGGASEATENTSKAAEGADTAAPSGEKTKITYWAPFSGGDGDIMTALVDEFNAQSPTTEVEFMIIKSEEYYTKLLAAMTSDSAPTVAVNHITRIKEYVTDELLEPLDSLAADASVDWTGFTKRLQEASQWMAPTTACPWIPICC